MIRSKFGIITLDGKNVSYAPGPTIRESSSRLCVQYNMDDGRLGELQGIYAEIEEAFRTKDLDVVAKYIAPNWVGMMGDEPVDRVQLLRNVKGQFETLDDISWPRTIAVIRSDATRIKVKAEGVYRATQRESGEPFEIALTNEDTWILGPEGWRNFASKSLG